MNNGIHVWITQSSPLTSPLPGGYNFVMPFQQVTLDNIVCKKMKVNAIAQWIFNYFYKICEMIKKYLNLFSLIQMTFDTLK